MFFLSLFIWWASVPCLKLALSHSEISFLRHLNLFYLYSLSYSEYPAPFFWYTPLILTLGDRGRWRYLIWSQPTLQSEFEDIQICYTEKSCPKNKKERCLEINANTQHWHVVSKHVYMNMPTHENMNTQKINNNNTKKINNFSNNILECILPYKVKATGTNIKIYHQILTYVEQNSESPCSSVLCL